MMKIRGILVPSLVDQLPLPEALKEEVKRVPKIQCELQQFTTQRSLNDSQTNVTNRIKNEKEVGQNLSMDSQSKKQFYAKQSSPQDNNVVIGVEKT